MRVVAIYGARLVWPHLREAFCRQASSTQSTVLPAREIETQALRALERLQKGQFREDSLVELKRELPDSVFKVARRIAGHCNAASGQTVLWIIGADEKDGIVGWQAPDLAEYLPRVWSHFHSERPETQAVALEFSGKPCTAFGFYAARPPYLIKNPEFGGTAGHVIENEIPWRDGTRVRTARRDDVMRLLTDYAISPDIEVFGGSVFQLSRRPNEDQPPAGYVMLGVHLEFYIMPRSADPIIVPHHRIRAELSDRSNQTSSRDFSGYRFDSRESRFRSARGLLRRATTPQVVVNAAPDDSVNDTGSELIISRPAHVDCYADTPFPFAAWEAHDEFKLELILPAGPDRVPFSVRSDAIKKRSNG